MPLEWYQDEEHIGYDREGDKLLRKAQRDRLDALLARHSFAVTELLIWQCICVQNAFILISITTPKRKSFLTYQLLVNLKVSVLYVKNV